VFSVYSNKLFTVRYDLLSECISEILEDGIHNLISLQHCTDLIKHSHILFIILMKPILTAALN